MDFVSTRIGVGRRVGDQSRSKFLFCAGTWGRDPGRSPGYRTSRAPEDPAKKENLDRTFVSSAGQLAWSGKMDFVSTRIGEDPGRGTSLGQSFLSVQGHGVGIWRGGQDIGPPGRPRILQKHPTDQTIWSGQETKDFVSTRIREDPGIPRSDQPLKLPSSITSAVKSIMTRIDRGTWPANRLPNACRSASSGRR
jgi:hypothetical protein